MPAWALIITGIAALLVASGIIWTKIKVVAELIAEGNRTVPVMRAFTDVFGSDPSILKVLREMGAEFRTDHGTTLRDVVNRLEVAAEANNLNTAALQSAVDQLRISSESVKELAHDDREQVARLAALLTLLEQRVVDAADLAAGVAEDLEASHVRAEAQHPEAAPGEAADAAAKRDPDAEG